MAHTPPSIAATSTVAMVRAAEARGFQTADLLEGAGLTPDFLDDPDARIPAPTVLSLWNALRERTGDPALQLAAPTVLPFGAYRVIEYLVAGSATVGDGIERFAAFFGLITKAVTLTITRDGDLHCVYLTAADGGAAPPVYVDYVFSALINRIRMRIRPDLQVHQVDLRQSEPAVAATYRETFSAPVVFGAPTDRLCLTDDAWNAPTAIADEALGQLMEEHARLLARRIPNAAPGFRAEVERAIAEGLPRNATAADVARALHVSVRTLQRKLVAAGATFREISDAVVAQLAEEYLSDPSVSIAEAAFLLGFSDQSSFNRAFRRWTGESPGRWRRRHA